MFLKRESPTYTSLRKKFQRELSDDLRYERLQKDQNYKDHVRKKIEVD